MNRQDSFSLISRLTGGRHGRRVGHETESAVHDPEALIRAYAAVPDPAGAKLTVPELEQAYRDLLLENQVLAESNMRLHERLARREDGTEESPATRELIRAQRNALAERSHRLREIEYENKRLKRQQSKLFEENKRLSASLAKHAQDIQPLLRREEISRRELAEAKESLRRKTSELLKLTDKYYQLEARTKPRPPPGSAANGDF